MQICHHKADVSSVSPLLDRLRECGLGVVYKMEVALMGGRRQEFLGVLLGGWGVGGLVVFFPEENTIKSLKAYHHQSLWKEN